MPSCPRVRRQFSAKRICRTIYYGQSLEKAVPGVSDPFKSQAFASHVAKLDVQTLGNAIFSRWRKWTHWDECPLDEDGWTWFVLALKRLAKLTEEDKV